MKLEKRGVRIKGGGVKFGVVLHSYKPRMLFGYSIASTKCKDEFFFAPKEPT